MEQITQDTIDFMGEQFRKLGLKPNKSKRLWTDDLGYCFSNFHIRIPSCGMGLFIDNSVTFLLSEKSSHLYEYSKQWDARLYVKEDPYAYFTANCPQWIMSDKKAKDKLRSEIESTVQHYRELQDYSVACKRFGDIVQNENLLPYYPAIKYNYPLVALLAGEEQKALLYMESATETPLFTKLLSLDDLAQRRALIFENIQKGRTIFKKYLK